MSRVTTALREIHTALEQGTEAQKTAAMGRLLRVAEVMDNPPDDRCYHCGSSMKMYWHALTPILVHALVKFKKAIVEKGENSVHLKKDMDGTDNQLSRHERSNWTKLRFHGLVAKVKEEGAHKRGYWLITRRGVDFLKGSIGIPDKVQTYKNKVVAHGENLVKVSDVIGSTPYVEDLPDIKFEISTGEEGKLEI